MSKALPRTLLLVVFLSSFIFFGTGCKKSNDSTTSAVPSVNTTDVILDVTSTTAQSGGTITATGTDVVTNNGVCYSTTNTTPTISDTKTVAPVSTTSFDFTANITGLTPNTTYYLRAFATSGVGTGYGAVIKFTTSSDVTSILGTASTYAGGNQGFMDGTGTGAQFYNPIGMAADAAGNVYVADAFNNRIRKITADGTVTTIAGDGKAGNSNGNALTEAEFYYPQSLAIDGSGNIFVSDFGNNVIRKITPAGVVSTFSGTGIAGYYDGAATVTQFSGPSGIAFDKNGNLIVADANNNIIRKVTPAGVSSTVAGALSHGYLNATVNTTTGVTALFDGPTGIAIDPANGNIYVADLGNNAIRQITTASVVTTIAGGPHQETVVGLPSGICTDLQGNLFISDESGRIVELTATRVLYSLAGSANVDGYADGDGTNAKFNSPQGIAVDHAGNIFVADFNNNRICKVVIKTLTH